MILPRYEDAFAALTDHELPAVLRALSLPSHHEVTRFPLTGTDVLEHCRARHISHADVIMSMATDRTPEAVMAVERLIMRPIDRRTPYEVNISRLDRPPGSHRANPAPARADDTKVIRLLATTNPKRPGSDSHDRFAYYVDGMTVADYIKRGGRRPDLAWDSDKGFIRLEDPA